MTFIELISSMYVVQGKVKWVDQRIEEIKLFAKLTSFTCVAIYFERGRLTCHHGEVDDDTLILAGDWRKEFEDIYEAKRYIQANSFFAGAVVKVEACAIRITTGD